MDSQSSKPDLDSQISLKERQIRLLDENIKDLTNHLQTLNKTNTTSTYVNIKKYNQFQVLKDAIGEIEQKFEISKKAIEIYHKEELEKVDEEILIKRKEIDKELTEIQKNKRNAVNLIHRLNDDKGIYTKMISDTFKTQTLLRSDWVRLRTALGDTVQKKNEFEALRDKLDDLYVNLSDIFIEKENILKREIEKEELINKRLNEMSISEEGFNNKIFRKNAELYLKEKELAEKEERLRIKEIQLNYRQDSLQHTFDKLRKMQGV